MSMHKKLLAVFLLAVVSVSSVNAQSIIDHFGFGKEASTKDIAMYFSISPSGIGLPAGSGTAKAGAEVFSNNCSACHGEKLEGNPSPGVGGDRLIGGRGSLATKSPTKTVESYWPYSTTLFDYVKRAMPFNAPGTLTDDQIYSVVAYILSEAKIIKATDVMNAQTLPKVVMPNKDGFIPDSRPELELYK